MRYTGTTTMKRLALFIITGIALYVGASAPTAHAENTGLNASPSRITLSATRGQTKVVTLTVKNDTPNPMTIPIGVEEFSVNNATNKLSFKLPEYDWITTQSRSVTLQPGQDTPVRFTITVPDNAATREYYYALIASTKINQKTVRVASLVYLYIDGGGIERKNDITDVTVPPYVFVGRINYGFTIKNNGNIHSQTRSTARLSGLNSQTSDADSYQIILPGKSHRVEGQVPRPFFPGIYTLSYGFTDQSSKKTMTGAAQIIYIPPWSIAASVVFILATLWLWQKRSR